MKPHHYRDRTACKNGHTYTEENTRWITRVDVYGNIIRARKCRLCDMEHSRKRRAAKRN
jgi:hypothetical protein